MFILFGFSSKPKVEGVIKNKCPSCQKKSLIRIVKVTEWFTLFFIPVIPLGSKVFLECLQCGSGYQLKNEAKEKMLELINKNHEKRLEKK